MNSWHSYPSVYNLGHRALEPLLAHPLNIEEKVDGSQFSFGRFDGVLRVRSKGQELIIDAPEKMFTRKENGESLTDLAPAMDEEETVEAPVKRRFTRMPVEVRIVEAFNIPVEEVFPTVVENPPPTKLHLAIRKYQECLAKGVSPESAFHESRLHKVLKDY